MPFRPTKKPDRIAFRNVKIEVTPERYDLLRERAKRSGISLKEFIRQCVDYAVSEMDD